jgi:hypothetical protein
MVKVHRQVVDAVGSEPPGVLLDTPFGFQVNADDLAARTVTYFAQSVGAPLAVAGVRSTQDLVGPGADAIVAGLAAAPVVFSGPGSPTYALRQWRSTVVPTILREKLTYGGAVTFSSAAALTLGAFTVPVYEIYKAGLDPYWEQGLDLLRSVDDRLCAAVVPHYDNAEGGTYDTRFCYLGEQRLARLQAELPEGAVVLGVDEHTALTFDIGAGRATVAGLGTVTVRVGGRSEVLPSGSTITVSDLVAMADRLRHGPAAAIPAGGSHTTGGATSGASTSSSEGAGSRLSPLLQAARAYDERFRRARAAGDAPEMVAAILDTEAELWQWRADPTQSEEQDRVRATLRTMVDTLGSVAEVGTRDPAKTIGPYVELALALRTAARVGRRFEDADRVRRQLAELGVEVRDGSEGSSWVLRGVEGAGPSC